MYNKILKQPLSQIALFTFILAVGACSNSSNESQTGTDTTTVSQPSSNFTEAPATAGEMPPNTAAPQELAAPTAVTSIKFAEMDHDFGKIKQETENKKVFKFTNTGQEPLLISNAVGSCGCTVPEYPKEPIAPGKTGEIVVIYKPGQQKGTQNKTVTLTANTDPSTTVLNIKADVQELKK